MAFSKSDHMGMEFEDFESKTEFLTFKNLEKHI